MANPQRQTQIAQISQVVAENHYDLESLGRDRQGHTEQKASSFFVVTASTSEICDICVLPFGPTMELT